MCRRRFVLTDRQRRTLARARGRHPKPHLRAQAAALLKVAGGWDIQDVAAWRGRYQAGGGDWAGLVAEAAGWPGRARACGATPACGAAARDAALGTAESSIIITGLRRFSEPSTRPARAGRDRRAAQAP